MRKEQERDPIRRYDQLWAAAYNGKKKIVSAVNVLHAEEKAAKIFGVDLDEFRENGAIQEPTRDETEKFCRDSGRTVPMIVETNYGTARVDAICREDAIRQAAQKLGKSFETLNTICTSVKIERLKNEVTKNGRNHDRDNDYLNSLVNRWSSLHGRRDQHQAASAGEKMVSGGV